MTPADTMRAAVEALPQQIINLPCRVPYIGHPDAVRQWREGHRAARHAAADLVSYALSLLRSALADDALRIAGAAGPLGDPDVLASPLPDEVLQLLNHIEDVIGDEAWARIDAKLWNAVTRLAAGVGGRIDCGTAGSYDALEGDPNWTHRGAGRAAVDAARICEQQAERWTDDRARYAAHECAAAIRAAGVGGTPTTFDEWWKGTGYAYGRETAREAWDAARGVMASDGSQP